MPVGFGFGRRPPQENVLGSSARFGCVRVRARVRVNVFVRVRVRVRVRRKEPKVAQAVLSSVAVLCPTVADEGATGRSLAQKLFFSDPT